MAETQSIENLAEEWLRLDKNPKTRAEIEGLLKDGNNEELERRLRHRIAFGTAGLRAEMNAGFSRMNDLIIIQASQGLAAYVKEQFPGTAADRGVVIGHDHRHNSEQFARLTAAAFIDAGIKVYFYDELVHTPLVPFGIKLLGAVAGVMVTASHNPGQDNGYKVYWENACQITPPHDTGIAASIFRNLEPKCWDSTLVDTSTLVEKPLARVREAYIEALKPIGQTPFYERASAPIRFVYTPMHGVGLPIMQKAVEGAGLLDGMVAVKEQATPDPDFPTVRFPNPEEHGALDLAISTAEAEGISIVLASDPDADRFACAEKHNGKWQVITGNQLGVILASHVLARYTGEDKGKLAMLCSTVSSQMLAEMARKEGFRFVDTLTGFKWLGNRALDLIAEGYDAEYAYEEAIGFMFTRLVPDKDGIAAAVAFLSLLKSLEVQSVKLTPIEYLETLYKKYGYFESCNSYLRSPDPRVTAKVFADIRALGGEESYPKTLGERRISYWRDLTLGYESTAKDHVPLLPVDASSQMITFIVHDESGEVRATIRGSGTEPKIKFYVECKAQSKETAAKGAKAVADDIINLWFKPQETGLIVPS